MNSENLTQADSKARPTKKKVYSYYLAPDIEEFTKCKYTNREGPYPTKQDAIDAMNKYWGWSKIWPIWIRDRKEIAIIEERYKATMYQRPPTI